MSTPTISRNEPTLPSGILHHGLTGEEFDRMVHANAFDSVAPKKVELLKGEIAFMNPAGPIHDDLIRYLTAWSFEAGSPTKHVVQVQCGLFCGDDRPEPDIAWLRPKRYGHQRPSPEDVLLLIEVAESSLAMDLRLKLDIYASGGVPEYWIVDIPGRQLHVFHTLEQGRYQFEDSINATSSIAPQSRPEARLDLSDLFSVV